MFQVSIFLLGLFIYVVQFWVRKWHESENYLMGIVNIDNLLSNLKQIWPYFSVLLKSLEQ